jgi:hypothetical protein
MWTTATIRIMATADQCQSVENGNSTTSTATRRGMGGAIQEMLAMTQATNMRFLERGAVAPAAVDTSARAPSLFL